MRRHAMIGAIAAAAALGMGTCHPPIEPYDDTDEGVRKAREEREIEHRRRVRQIEARREREAQERRRDREELDKLRNGIEPSTGQPISRQRRRALQRQNFDFTAEYLDAIAAAVRSTKTRSRLGPQGRQSGDSKAGASPTPSHLSSQTTGD